MNWISMGALSREDFYRLGISIARDLLSPSLSTRLIANRSLDSYKSLAEMIRSVSEAYRLESPEPYWESLRSI